MINMTLNFSRRNRRMTRSQRRREKLRELRKKNSFFGKLKSKVGKAIGKATNAVGEAVESAREAGVPEQLMGAVKSNLPAIQNAMKVHAQNKAVKRANKQREKFLNANPHIKLQVGINQRNAYIDSIMGAQGAHTNESAMRSNYNAMKRASSGGPIKLQGVNNVY